MVSYSTFANLMKDQATHDSLPTVLFTENADLRSSTTRLALSSEGDQEVSVENVADVVKELDTFNTNRMEYGDLFGSFETIADAFATKLNEGISSLRAVKSDVTALKDKCEETTAMRIAEDATLSKVCGIEKELTIDSIEWKYLDAVDERYLVEEVHNRIGHDPDRPITRSILDMVVNSVPGANNVNKPDLKEIKLENKTISNCIKNLKNFIPDESDEFVGGMFINLLKLSSLDCELAVRKLRNYIEGKHLDQMVNMLHVAYGYNKLYDAIKSTDMDLAASSMEELGKHVDAMRAISNTILYIAGYYRNTVWKDAVLVPGPYANPDNMEQFTTDGGTPTRLVQHYKKFYSDVEIPVKGVSGKFIIQSAERLENEFTEEAAKNVAFINAEKKRIERASFITTSVEYLKNTILSPKFASRNDLSKYAASVYDSMVNAPVESRFYKLIINAKYPNSVTSMLYDRIGKTYAEYAEKTGKLSKETCEELDIKVYADMISEYLVNQGVLVV